MKKTILITFLFFCSVVKAQITLTHNLGIGPIENEMFTCSGLEIECWARSYVLEDFGISTEYETKALAGKMAYRLSYAGATAKFNIYAIDNNFPESFSHATLLGSSQIEVIPPLFYPQTITTYFNNPIIIPPHVERILVEVEKGDNPNSSATREVYIAGSEYENDYSWYKGCGQNFTYKTTNDIGPPRPNANFIVNLIVEATLLSDQDDSKKVFSFYPNPAHDFLTIDSQFPLDSILIYNLQGVLVKESISENINVSELPSGIYFLKVKGNGKFQTKKLIKS